MRCKLLHRVAVDSPKKGLIPGTLYQPLAWDDEGNLENGGKKSGKEGKKSGKWPQNTV